MATGKDGGGYFGLKREKNEKYYIVGFCGLAHWVRI
jgi:hypothetical protein